jgi:hypothetical protein
MGIFVGLHFLARLAGGVFAALAACAAQNSSCAAQEIHVTIIDPGQKQVYSDTLSSLPDSGGIPGGWLRNEAIRNALIKDPDLTDQALQILSDPERIHTIAMPTPEQFHSAMGYLSKVPIPLADTGLTVGQLATITDAATTALLYMDGLDPESRKKQKEQLTSLLENQPFLMHQIVSEIRSGVEDTNSPLGSRSALLHDQLGKLIADGKLPDILGNPAVLIDQLPPNAVALKLADLLRESSAEDVAGLKTDGAKLRAFLKTKLYPAIVDQGLVLDDLKKRTDAILSNLMREQEKAAAREAHVRAVAEARGGVALASGLIRLIDPQAGHVADFVDKAGNAVIDGEQAIEALTEGFSFVASANLIGAAVKIAGLFGGGGDAAALRQQQIMNSLSRISRQIEIISQKLDVIDRKLTLLQESVSNLQALTEQQFRNTLSFIASLDDRLSAVYAEFLDRQFDDQVVGINRQLQDCGDSMRRRKIPLLPADEDVLRKCLAQLKGFGLIESQRTTLTLKDFSIDNQAYDKVAVREKYPSALIGAFFRTQALANGTAADFSGSMNSDVWGMALQSYIDLLYLTPEFNGAALVKEDLTAFRKAAVALKGRIDGFDESAFVENQLSKYSELLNDVVWQRLDILRSIANGVYPQSAAIIPNAYIAGYDLEQALIAARCKRRMPDFFEKYHDVDQGGYLIRARAEGTSIDFKRAGIGMIKMDLDVRDLIFSADALNLLDWQLETVSVLQRRSSIRRTECDAAFDADGPHGPHCRSQTLYREQGLGSVVVRYNARLRGSDKIVAYYEDSRPAANEVQKESTNRNDALGYVNAYEAEMIRSVSEKLRAIRILPGDFASRGASWTALTVNSDVRFDVAGPEDPRFGIPGVAVTRSLREEIRKHAEEARSSIYRDARAVSVPPGYNEAVQAALDEIYISVKVPLIVKYGSCGEVNPYMRRILSGLKGGHDYANEITRSGGIWRDDIALKPLLRATPHDEISVEMGPNISLDLRQTFSASALFDRAIAEFRSNAKNYRLCSFGLDGLDGGIEAIDHYVSTRLAQ